MPLNASYVGDVDRCALRAHVSYYFLEYLEALDQVTSLGYFYIYFINSVEEEKNVGFNDIELGFVFDSVLKFCKLKSHWSD